MFDSAETTTSRQGRREPGSHVSAHQNWTQNSCIEKPFFSSTSAEIENFHNVGFACVCVQGTFVW